MAMEIMNVEELAHKLKISKATVRAWCHRTDIPRLRIGRLIRFDFNEVLGWLWAGGSLGEGRRVARDREQQQAGGR